MLLQFIMILYAIELLIRNISMYRWAMSSLTQKGKGSDHGPVSSANASNSQISATSSVTSGIRLFFKLL
jgi:SCY1-like protein 1